MNMKRTLRLICNVVSLLVVVQVAVAGNSDIEIHCFAKKMDEKVNKASDGGANTTKERWSYEVTVENKTFKPLANLDVKYAMFFKQERLGEKANPTPGNQTGSFSIPALGSHEKKTFTTDAVELHKANLVG